MSRSCQRTLVGAFGAVQIGVRAQAVLVDMASRAHNTAGYLHIGPSCLRLSLHAACRLQRLLVRANVAAKADEPRQPGPRANSTIVHEART
jgi:hypothetical protein